MPRFNFRLQRVLQIKKYKEDQLKIELANLKREYLQQESILWTLEESLQEQFVLLSEKQRKLDNNTLNEILWSYNYIIMLRENIENQKKRLEKLNGNIEKVTTKLIGAAQEKQILANLKKRKLTQFKLEVEKEEQEFMDEVGITRYGREQVKAI